jgi:amidase
MTTFTVRLDALGSGLRVAVKDLLDMRGLPTTAGSRAVAETAAPAAADAACLAGLRAEERAGRARVVGRTVLHELAFGITGITGINGWAGTPQNPADPARIPGGSSSGSAAAVASGEADVALGSDTGGSVRIPAACCAVAGLKTTWGRVPLDGVWPLAPSLDTVGPLARDVAGLVAGMRLLEPGFEPAAEIPRRVGRLRVPAAPDVDAALDRALSAAGLELVELGPGLTAEWRAADEVTGRLLAAEAWRAHGGLLQRDPGAVGADVAARLLRGRVIGDAELAELQAARRAWRRRLQSVLVDVDVVALPTLGDAPPPLGDADGAYRLRATLPVNLAGLPALSLPVPRPGAFPASLQLVAGAEEALLGLGARVEAVAAP